jgi:hypothetical protein
MASPHRCYLRSKIIWALAESGKLTTPTRNVLHRWASCSTTSTGRRWMTVGCAPITAALWRGGSGMNTRIMNTICFWHFWPKASFLHCSTGVVNFEIRILNTVAAGTGVPTWTAVWTILPSRKQFTCHLIILSWVISARGFSVLLPKLKRGGSGYMKCGVGPLTCRSKW